MTTLEFIRKNSIVVLVAIVAVGMGLVFMDYGDKGSRIARDFYISVGDTDYSFAEVEGLGSAGQSYLHTLYSSANTKLRNKFDTNQDEQIDQTEAVAMQAWLMEHPEYQHFVETVSSTLQNWSYGAAEEATVNVALNRAILRAESAKLGIAPSKEQVDAYIQAMPPFRNDDGSFDQALYQRLTGYRNGVANNAQEKSFRSVVSDMMIWECLTNLLTDDLSYQTKTLSDLVDTLSQKVSGKTAWLPAAAAPAPAEPTEEELQAYWQLHQENYKSEEERIVSLYELKPAEGSSLDALTYTADALMQDLSQANGKGLDALVEAAAENPEFEPFTYKNAEGATHTTFALSTLAKAADALNQEVEANGKTTTLAEIAFKDVASAPEPSAYEEALKAGTAEQLPTITQVRGYYVTKSGSVVLLRVEAAVPPTVLPYTDEVKAAALADLKKERADNALDIAAHELFDNMQKAIAEGADLNAAFAKAAEAGAEVADYGPVGIGLNEQGELPHGLETQVLLSVASGKLAPLTVLPEGARITGVSGRTFEDTPDYAAMKAFNLVPSQNAQLKGNVLMEWLNAAYERYKVQLAISIKRNN